MAIKIKGKTVINDEENLTIGGSATIGDTLEVMDNVIIRGNYLDMDAGLIHGISELQFQDTFGDHVGYTKIRAANMDIQVNMGGFVIGEYDNHELTPHGIGSGSLHVKSLATFGNNKTAEGYIKAFNNGLSNLTYNLLRDN